jgi:hypothetical protein
VEEWRSSENVEELRRGERRKFGGVAEWRSDRVAEGCENVALWWRDEWRSGGLAVWRSGGVKE